MSQKPSLARIMATDWHTLLPLLIALLAAIWTAVYPFLDPSHFQLQNALDSAAIAIIAFVFAHAYGSLKQQQLSVDGSGTTLHPAVQRASLDRPPYTPN